MPLGAFSTAWRISPSVASSVAPDSTHLPSSSSDLKLVRTPATEVRENTSIGLVEVAPANAELHVLALPVKTWATCACVRLLTGLDLLVTTQIAYLAIG